MPYVCRTLFEENALARTARDARLETRNARQKLKPRREPYWRSIYMGAAVGYRKGASGGSWIARHYDPSLGRRYIALGTADDLADADGVRVLSFSQAQEKARSEFTSLARADAGDVCRGPYSVSQALADYLVDYERRGGKSRNGVQTVIKAHLEPRLGRIELKKLTRSHVENWFHQLADAPARVRTKKDQEIKFRQDPMTDDVKRRRRATANRCFGVLKAALNYAYAKRHVESPDAWVSVKPFRNVSTPVIRYLTESESRRLVNAADQEFRPLVKAALLTGCRYGELAALRAHDFNSESGTVIVRTSKSGKPRHVVLTDEAQRFFVAARGEKNGSELMFTKHSNLPWRKSNQQKPLAVACKAANITPAIRFHDLRHTHGSTLAMKGVPLAVIAAQLGHADTRMTERHYAHLSPSHIAETIRANFPDLGIQPQNHVIVLVGKVA